MITDLAGTANGLSSARDTRSQFSLEGAVDEFGFARLSGALNPFQPREQTNFRVEFRNLDLTRASSYSIKFAGYRIAAGRLSRPDRDAHHRGVRKRFRRSGRA